MLEVEIGRASPQHLGVIDQRLRLRRIEGELSLGSGDEQFEAGDVELLGRHVEPVAGGSRADRLVTEPPPQLRDAVLQDLDP